MFKSRTRFLAAMACLSVFLLCGTLAFCLETQNLGSNVNIQYIAPKTEDLWNAENKTFYKNNLNKLLQQISNDATSSITNMAQVDSLATAKTSAGTMRNYTTGKSSGEDITVQLGGLTWTVTYLSTTKTGETILTLWLDGKANNITTSSFTNGWTQNNPTQTYPCNMYGRSYIRAEILNNGGKYATSGTTVETSTKKADNIFAMFTMGELTNYLVTPRQVDWQEDKQYATNQLKFSCNLPNENWSENFPTVDFYYDTYNYASKKGDNDAWADDYIWLPSITETGYSDSKIGIWNLSVAQRTCSTATWLRSGYSNNVGYVNVVYAAGNDYDAYTADKSYAVRPALHLNLTEAVKNAI